LLEADDRKPLQKKNSEIQNQQVAGSNPPGGFLRVKGTLHQVVEQSNAFTAVFGARTKGATSTG